MQRRSPLILGLISLIGASALAVQSNKLSKNKPQPAPLVAADIEVEKASSPDHTEKEKSLAPITEAARPPLAISASTFHLMPDGSPVPALKDSAPSRVKLGVAIFRYKGAQGTSASTRSKEQAMVLAEKAISTAKDDFAAAVKQGDRGSSQNIGWIGQRILERSVEYSVFSLDKGGVSNEPIDTPRGLWIVKRLR